MQRKLTTAKQAFNVTDNGCISKNNGTSPTSGFHPPSTVSHKVNRRSAIINSRFSKKKWEFVTSNLSNLDAQDYPIRFRQVYYNLPTSK